MTLEQIIKDVARRQGVSPTLAGGFVRDAIEELARVLDSGGTVKVRGLGSFGWQKAKARSSSGAFKGLGVPAGWKLHFLPARRYRGRRTAMSDPDAMTKYGVELDDNKTKQASEQPGKPGRCPTCQRVLDDAGACPVHGTEPLESTGQRKR